MKAVKRALISLYRKNKEYKIYKIHARNIKKLAASIGRSQAPEVSAAAVKKVWAPYAKVDPVWAQVYAQINGIASPYYFPSYNWFRLIRAMRGKSPAHVDLPDKNYTDLLFKDSVRLPETLLHKVSNVLLDADYRMISAEDAIDLCARNDELVIKPSTNTHGGDNVLFVTKSGSEEEFKEQIRREMGRKGRDFIVQLPLKQHPAMAALNPDSVNTVRMLTLLWKGEVRIIGSLVRVGVKGVRVDNPHSSNGVSCVIDEEGFLNKTAYDRDWRPHAELPSGIVCEGLQLPGIKAIREKVIELHQRIPYALIVGWDMVVSEDGEPAMIEFNTGGPEIYFHQIAAGPIFEPELFRDIMDTYFKK